MRVDGHAVGESESRKRVPVPIGHDGRCPVGAIDVEPEILPPADRGDPLEGIDAPGVGRACRPDDRERPISGAAVLGDHRLEVAGAHPEAIVGRDDSKVRRADPEQFDRLADAAMALVRDVDTEPWPTGEALLALVPAGASVAGRGEAGQVGHRAAGDKNAARGCRETDHVAKPVEDLVFQVDGRVVRDIAMRVHGGSKRVAEDRHDVSGRADPCPEPAVVVPERVRGDLVAEGLQQLRRLRSLGGKRPGSQRPGDIRWHGAKDRPVR